MCERCGADFAFLGLAEPQAAMLPSYIAALMAGWSPDGSETGAEQHLRDAKADPAAFLHSLADHIERDGSPAADPVHAHLVRWLWDGGFCGTVTLRADRGGELQIACSLVDWKQQHDYCERARRQIMDEVRDLGLTGTPTRGR